jgi:hypothetical protein
VLLLLQFSDYDCNTSVSVKQEIMGLCSSVIHQSTYFTVYRIILTSFLIINQLQ